MGGARSPRHPNNTLKVWDVATGALVAMFTCDAAALCCTFIADDQLMGGDAGGRVYFLRLEETKSRSYSLIQTQDAESRKYRDRALEFLKKLFVR